MRILIEGDNNNKKKEAFDEEKTVIKFFDVSDYGGNDGNNSFGGKENRHAKQH